MYTAGVLVAAYFVADVYHLPFDRVLFTGMLLSIGVQLDGWFKRQRGR